MSKYQYYEFVALDRPLVNAHIQELRKVSYSAEISTNRFVDIYGYGDFKGDVYEFMTRFFDVMVYVANWGTHRLVLRLPADLFDRAQGLDHRSGHNDRYPCASVGPGGAA